MSDFVTYASIPIRDIAALPLKKMISELIADADFVMKAGMDDSESEQLIKWLVNFLYDRYGYMTLTHVEAAIKEGSLGRRLGTSKLTPRNIDTWLSEQLKICQEQQAAFIRKVDDQKRKDEQKNRNIQPLAGTAVRLKVEWLADGRITSEQYDSFSSKLIYDLLEKGIAPKDIHPRDVVPNYERRVS